MFRPRNVKSCSILNKHISKLRVAERRLQSHLPDLGMFIVLGSVINICTLDMFLPFMMGNKRRLHLASAPWLGLGQVRQGCGWRQDSCWVWSHRWDVWNTCPCEWSYVQLIDKQDGYVQERSMTAN